MQPTRKSYALTFAALLALSGLTLGLSFVPLGAVGIAAGLCIATAKAVLIASFFMHLVEQRAANAFLAVLAVLLVGVFVGITAGEVGARQDARGERAAETTSGGRAAAATAARAPGDARR